MSKGQRKLMQCGIVIDFCLTEPLDGHFHCTNLSSEIQCHIPGITVEKVPEFFLCTFFFPSSCDKVIFFLGIVLDLILQQKHHYSSIF